MKINELLESKTVTEGPLGTAIGAGLGALAGGPLGAAAGGIAGNWAGNKLSSLGSKLKGAWQGAKAGFATGQQAAAGGTGGSAAPAAGDDEPAAPAAGGSAAPAAGGNAPASTTGSISDIMKTIDTLDKSSKQQLAGELEKNITSTPEPAAATPAKPSATAPAGSNATTPATAAPATPDQEPPESTTGRSAFGQMASQLGSTPTPTTSSTGGTIQKTATGVKNTANPNNPNAQVKQQPSSTVPAAATPATTAAAKTPQANQAALKAKLQGQRAAGKSMAQQTGGGFGDYVAGSPNTGGFDAQGNAIPNKIKREDVQFASKFLGMMI
jgi:hypothetical protein